MTFYLLKEKNIHDRTEEILHKGIATRSFEKRFTLGPTIEIVDAILKDGILSIKLFKNQSKKILKKNSNKKAMNLSSFQIIISDTKKKINLAISKLKS